MNNQITSQTLLQAYASGIFPMADSRDTPELFWVDPRFRGIFELDRFHISKSLARRMKRGHFQITVDRAFEQVVNGCADRTDTWINAPLFELYRQLHHQGFAHSLEVWDGDQLIGGVYGLTIGAAFFGESMFSRQTDASKIALAYLVDRLRLGGFQLFDTQFITPHLASLGAIEIPRHDYRKRLAAAISQPADFRSPPEMSDVYSVLQRNTQTS
ncbi:MAG: leucyl/phenylalanyl-tRNA--protein transferase [Rhodobacterales bacterium]|nr:MAG: leucyl/phenylalanyl-tRNA--protein transferase [Rhodobacterales bacterium]